jgi:hypothetical protein
MLPTRALLVALAFTASAGTFAQIPGQTFPTPTAAQVTQSATGFDATLGAETMRVTVCADTIVHVVTRPPQVAASSATPIPRSPGCSPTLAPALTLTSPRTPGAPRSRPPP